MFSNNPQANNAADPNPLNDNLKAGVPSAGARVHPLAGQVPPADMLPDIAAIEQAYFSRRVDMTDPSQHVVFGTSGHRGQSLKNTYTEAHVAAITQAVCDYRSGQFIDGPLFMGMDTHALSALSHRTALEVLAANGVQVVCTEGAAPTPVISQAIVTYNRYNQSQRADGLLHTPSHNPPDWGGLKYNPPNGGAAESKVTAWIEKRANEILCGGNQEVRRVSFAEALGSGHVAPNHDFIARYVEALGSVVDMDLIRSSGVRIAVDPLGGASLKYWEPIADRYGINLTVLNTKCDPAWSFARLDHDGKLRMDPSSRYPMAGLLEQKDRFHVLVANDPDADRHGIATPGMGLFEPNRFLAVAIDYLLSNRPRWDLGKVAIGKTVASSSLIDRVVAEHGCKLYEGPVGFKWFSNGLATGNLAFAGEESAGAAFLDFNGQCWTSDKDGLQLALLAAEITARTGADLREYYDRLVAKHGIFLGDRIDLASDDPQSSMTADNKILAKLVAGDIGAEMLAGDRIVSVLTSAPGNGASIGGIKIMTNNGWLLVRPSGTEPKQKWYMESFCHEEHRQRLFDDGQQVIAATLANARARLGI